MVNTSASFPISKIDGYTFPQYFSDNDSFAIQNNLKGFALLKYRLKIKRGFKAADKRLKESIDKGKCYYGPFKGEFGHFTAHTLPFLMFLHSKGVKIIYCGMTLHLPFLIDEHGNSIISNFRPLRDFFAEVTPKSNGTIPPGDVQFEIDKFEKEANASGFPFWNIGDNFYYWFIHRNWLLNNHTKVYHINKFYGPIKNNTCCVFPRNKGKSKSHNNGESWDYNEVINLLVPYFDKVFVCGHPSQVKELTINHPKVEICVSTDNTVMLKKTSSSKLIITQHSGVNNVGEFVNTQVLIIYKGGTKVDDIGSMNNTLRFRHSLENKFPLAFAFNNEQIIDFVRRLSPMQNACV